MDILRFILIPISMCFSFGLYYFHVEFWINYFNESSAKIVGISFFTIPLFPIFGMIQIFRTFRELRNDKGTVLGND